MTLATFTFNLDPVLVHLGPLQIRYYGAVFALTLLVAFWVWRRQMLRGGYSAAVAERFLAWGTIATLAGARLGHCLFYEPARYLSDPLTILFFWEGGLASHGATIGLLLALFLFARSHRVRTLELVDRFAMSAAVGASGIRLANFLNSEVVGREATVPWAVHFMRYEDHGAAARHPSQLYEFALGLTVLLALALVDRWAGREKRLRGLMTGLFLALYFGGRFFVEFFKEYQTDFERADLGQTITMGQMLSIVPFVAGVALLVWVKRHPRTAPPPPVPPPHKSKNKK